MMRNLALIGIIVMFTSCNNSIVYEEYKSFENQKWIADSIVSFNYSINDTTSKNKIKIKLRHTVDYEFQNLFLFVKTEMMDTVELILANKEGMWLGNGIGDVCDINSQGNFTISKKDVTCIGKRNGEITVNATAQFSYNLNVIGSNGQKVESTFSAQNEIMISNIPVGDYSVCITAIEDPNFERCFITTINTPDPLSVQTQLNVAKKSVSVELEGASKYNLKINNQQYSLSSGRHDFSLEQGLSTIEVKTELSCQGTVKREIYLSDQSSLYPNPARDVVNVLVGGKENQVKILLYKTDGTLLNETDFQLSELERAYQIPLDGQAS